MLKIQKKKKKIYCPSIEFMIYSIRIIQCWKNKERKKEKNK